MAGAAAAAAAMAFGEVAAALVDPVPSLVDGMASAVIDHVPAWLERAAISLFGTADKIALGVGMVTVTLAVGAVVGRRWGPGVRAGMAFCLLGLGVGLVTGTDTAVPAGTAAIHGTASGLAGWLVLRWLLPSPTRPDPSRRRFVFSVLGTLGLAGLGRWWAVDRVRASTPRVSVALPAPAEPARPAPTGITAPGVSPLVTPNRDFFRIDTAFLGPPVVDVAEWSLKVRGMVDREVVLTYQDLVELPMVERYVTLVCVSNEVGGELVGNALWLGVPLHRVLDLAGVDPRAEQIVGRSVDGFTVGFPVAAAYDGRDALVAVGMNSEPLPLEHGFPARLVVAGLYGYVSATKWLSEIELTTWDAFDAYWVPRGWSKRAPVKIQSRIDVPRSGRTLDAGRVVVAGVAWAPPVGVGKVEVEIDGTWREAELGPEVSPAAWRQWKLVWDATPGRHTLRVRATDRDGVLQIGEPSPPPPDGATGWHTVTLVV